jgi:hypothetical protein
MKRKYTPVRYIDKLLTLALRLDAIRAGIEASDPEVAQLLDLLRNRLNDTIFMINRDGLERIEAALRARK